ncbi:uncharacterized protein LOC135841151 [Planococcus citri]|uniref:uncharacterized protein LOC135841151 n=1 Tax=Planococcus citri TaxID=170843 RepID=UPI0031F8DA39
MSCDGNFGQRFNAIERDRDFFAPEELPDQVLDDSSAHQIKKLDNGVETSRIDLEDRNTYVHAHFIPTLEDMATLTATLETLHYHYSENFYDYLRDVNKVIDNLMVPNRIREKITALCAEMKKEMCSLRFSAGWRGLDRPLLKLRHIYDNDSYFYVYGLVWNSNGHIDDKKTIEKALSYSKRSNNGDSVFQIMSKYCIVNRIMDFPLDSLSKPFIHNQWALEADKLTRYWIRYKRRITNDIHVGSYESALNSLLNSLKQSLDNKYQWSAYEYFWDFFNENDQTALAISLIQDENYKRYQKILFSMLSKNQLKRLYSEEPFTIIVNFVSLGELELANAVWDRIKLTIEFEQYELLIEQIWKKEIPEENCMRFLIYSWHTAPLNLIDYMINVKNCEIMNKLIYGEPIQENSGRFEFLKALLSRTTPEIRRRYLQHAGPCLSLNHPDVFSSLIDHCFNETDGDSLTVKENILIEEMESNLPAGIMHRFRDLFYSNREEFNKFLESFTLKLTLQTRFKECLLQSNLLITKVLWKAENWQKLSQFIDELFPNREVARYQKRKVVFTFSRTHCNYHDCYRPNGDEKFTEIDNLLSQVLTHREVITAKENIGDRFLETCRSKGIRSLKRMNL